MKYRITKGTKPTLPSYNRYTAKAIHLNTITARMLEEEIQSRCSATTSDVLLVLGALQDVIVDHLQRGDKVELPYLGTLKMEIESKAVDSPEDFCPYEHIKRASLHLVPKSSNGKPEVYEGLHYENYGL